jgi:hypothetical protein
MDFMDEGTAGDDEGNDGESDEGDEDDEVDEDDEDDKGMDNVAVAANTNDGDDVL